MSHNTDTIWYVSREGQRYGPLTQEEFAANQQAGNFRQTDLIWHANMKDWVLFGQYGSKPQLDDQVAKSRRQSTRWWSSVRALSIKLISYPRRLLLTAIDLVFRPTAFAKQRIDVFPRDLARATYFFLNLFSVAFLLASSFSYLNGTSGMSQVREFAGQVIQMGVAILLLQVAAVLTKQSVRAAGIAQAVLYIDAVFILLHAIIGIAVVSYLAGQQTPAEPNLFANEYEACLAGEFFLYWLLRGDLVFYSAPIVSTNLLTTAVVDYLEYIVAAPFCVTFGLLLKGRYGASAVKMGAAGVIAFVAVVATYPLVIRGTTNSIAQRSPCFEASLRTVEAKYSRATVLRQTAHQINGELIARTSEHRLMVYPRATGLAMDVRSREDGSSLLQQAQATIKAAAVLYCDDYTKFRYAKSLRLPLTVTVQDPAGQPLLTQDITTADCSRR